MENIIKIWKEILKEVTNKFNTKAYSIVSYQVEQQIYKGISSYMVTIVIKSKRNYDEGHLLALMQEFPDILVNSIE